MHWSLPRVIDSRVRASSVCTGCAFSIGAFELLRAAAVTDFGRINRAFAVDCNIVHPLEVADHVPRSTKACQSLVST
jgi:hypothetical protein